VGVEDTVLLETHAHDVQPGDLYLLCSDGLSDMLHDATIAQILLAANGTLDEACRTLVDAANDAGGRDNISVILIRSHGAGTQSGRSWWPFRR
jgi:PPM family protein phosphatase